MKRSLVLIIALAAGLAAAILTRLYVSAVENDVREQKAALLGKYGSMEALCYTRDVPAGTVLAREDFGLRTLPRKGLENQALTKADVDAVVGRKTVSGRQRGDVVFWADIDGGDTRIKSLSASVQRQMRAISINVSGSSGVSGMVKPNDHVDVIGTFDFPGENGKRRNGDLVTCTMLQNVLVLAVGRDTAKSMVTVGATSQGYALVTLQVTPREAEMLAFAEQIKGRLVLTLRNPGDTSFESELPKVDFEKIRGEIEDLNVQRQRRMGGR